MSRVARLIPLMGRKDGPFHRNVFLTRKPGEKGARCWRLSPTSTCNPLPPSTTQSPLPQNKDESSSIIGSFTRLAVVVVVVVPFHPSGNNAAGLGIERCMMRTREIVYEQWQLFFNDFTQLHQGKHVNVETMGDGDFGVKSRWCDLPLVGIVCAHPQPGEDEWIEVIARDSPDTHSTYSIVKPSKVQLAEEENGRAVALEIESGDGSITMIRFEPSRENMPQGFRVS